jgi:hypothetical protein
MRARDTALAGIGITPILSMAPAHGHRRAASARARAASGILAELREPFGARRSHDGRPGAPSTVAAAAATRDHAHGPRPMLVP